MPSVKAVKLRVMVWSRKWQWYGNGGLSETLLMWYNAFCNLVCLRGSISTKDNGYLSKYSASNSSCGTDNIVGVHG